MSLLFFLFLSFFVLPPFPIDISSDLFYSSGRTFFSKVKMLPPRERLIDDKRIINRDRATLSGRNSSLPSPPSPSPSRPKKKGNANRASWKFHLRWLSGGGGRGVDPGCLLLQRSSATYDLQPFFNTFLDIRLFGSFSKHYSFLQK